MLFFLPLTIVIISLLFGYFFWKSSRDKYGYNVFNISIMLRLAISIIFCVISLEIGLVVLGICLIWNFISVYKNTSLFNAILFLLFFQPAALLFAFWILTRKWD